MYATATVYESNEAQDDSEYHTVVAQKEGLSYPCRMYVDMLRYLSLQQHRSCSAQSLQKQAMYFLSDIQLRLPCQEHV